MFEAFIDRCVVDVFLYFVRDRPQYAIYGYHCGRLATEEMLASRFLIRVPRSSAAMSGHCVVA